MMSGRSESYIPIFVINRRNPIAVTCVGMTSIAMINVNAAFFILKSYAYRPYAVSDEKYVHRAAEHDDTIRLLRIPRNIGKLPSFATFFKFSRKYDPGIAEKPFCRSAWERVEFTIRI